MNSTLKIVYPNPKTNEDVVLAEISREDYENAKALPRVKDSVKALIELFAPAWEKAPKWLEVINLVDGEKAIDWEAREVPAEDKV